MNPAAQATLFAPLHPGAEPITPARVGQDEQILDALSFSDILLLVVSETGVVEGASGGFIPASDRNGVNPLLNASIFDVLSPVPTASLSTGLAHALVGERTEMQALVAGLPCFITFAPAEGRKRCLITVWPGMGSDEPTAEVSSPIDSSMEFCDVGRVARWLRPGFASLLEDQTELAVWVQPGTYPTLLIESNVTRVLVSLVDALRLFDRRVPSALLSVSHASVDADATHHDGVAVRLRANSGEAVSPATFELLQKHCARTVDVTGVRIVITEAEDGVALTALLPSPRVEESRDRFSDAVAPVSAPA